MIPIEEIVVSRESLTGYFQLLWTSLEMYRKDLTPFLFAPGKEVKEYAPYICPICLELLKRGLLFSHITNPFSFTFYCVPLFHLFTSFSYRTIVKIDLPIISNRYFVGRSCEKGSCGKREGGVELKLLNALLYLSRK